jgi:hypothetical protein
MKTVILTVFGLLSGLLTVAQATSTAKPAIHRTTASNGATSLAPVTPQAATSPADEEKIRELTHRIQKLELDSIQRSGSQRDSTVIAVITAVIAAAAVFGAALLGIVGQYFTARREERRAIVAAERAAELARQEAIYKHTEKILEFRLKQMEQFYAPMFALLGQSVGLYDKMRNQLVQDQPERYRWAPDVDPKDGRVQVLDKDGTWKDFRLLDQFPAVRKNPRALALADRVLEIGKEITHTISRHAGLASEDLLDVLGKYMAHYAILSAIRQDDRSEPYPAGSHKIGYYPRELDAKIAVGYREVAQLIANYAKASKRLVEGLPATEGSQGS